MKRILSGQLSLALWTALLIISATTATAADFAIDTTNANNGLFDIYSATFDLPLDPDCTGAADPDACAFFGGKPPTARAIVVAPTPTGVVAAADTTLCVQDFSGTKVVPPCPNGTLYATATPSSLDLTLSAGNTQMAINGGNVFFPDLVIVINGGLPDQTDVPAEGASIVNFAPSAGTVPVNGSGVAIIEVDIAPATAADFATFTEIVTNCTGPLCGLIPILTLDMQRYRLIIDWDPTFTFFTAEFAGQTANNSIVSATFDSVVPIITVTDLLVPFGNILKGTVPPDEIVTITNDGDADLGINQITQPAAPFSVLSDTCSNRTLAPAANCTLNVHFAPSSTGDFSSSFSIPSNDPNTPTETVDVTGKGVASIITVISPVAFGDVTITTSFDKTVTITNQPAATADLIIGDIAVANPLGAPFSIFDDPCSGATLVPGEPCTLTIRFAPTALGLAQDSFDIPSNDPDNLVSTVDVSGSGTAVPVAKISVTNAVDFGSVIELTTGSQVVTITSSGTADLIIGQITQPGAPFDIPILDDNCSGQTLVPTDNCTLTVQFSPIMVGLEQDSFDIPSNDLGFPTITVNVIGTGTTAPAPEIVVTDSVLPDDDHDIPFGDVAEMATAVEMVTITNNGTANLVINQITQLAAPFSLIDDLCSNQTLAPATNCTLRVQFAPSAIGSFSGSINISSNDPNAAVVAVTVDGVGAPGPAPRISVSDEIPPKEDLWMPYSDVTEGVNWDRVITITNTGNANLQMGMIGQVEKLAEPFSIISDSCSGQVIEPAAVSTPPPSCTVTIRFLPTEVDSFDDSLDIQSNDPNEPVLIFSVSGNGVVLGDGTISLRPSGADSGLFGTATGPGALLALFMLVAANLRRRRCRQG